MITFPRADFARTESPHRSFPSGHYCSLSNARRSSYLAPLVALPCRVRSFMLDLFLSVYSCLVVYCTPRVCSQNAFLDDNAGFLCRESEPEHRLENSTPSRHGRMSAAGSGLWRYICSTGYPRLLRACALLGGWHASESRRLLGVSNSYNCETSRSHLKVRLLHKFVCTRRT